MVQKPSSNSSLPEGIAEELGAIEPTESNIIVELKGEIKTLQDALSDSQETVRDLENQIKVLSDDSAIKMSAFKYARFYLWFVPIFCVLLLIAILNKGLILNINGKMFSIFWAIETHEYLPIALLVVPVAFIATLLGYLFRGVFGNPNGDIGKESSGAIRRLLDGGK